MRLECREIEITLSNNEIVKDASLHVQDGQFVGLLGPNGCGKSTLLRAIYRALSPNSGVITLGDMDVRRTPSKVIAKYMGVVSQFNNVNFDISVRQMVLAGRIPHQKLLERDTAEDFEIVRRALAAVEMTSFADRSYATLSGGEKQRVILARAIAQEPSFMVLDEPTNHLDIKYQLSILSTVKGLGIGVLAALHDLNLAALYCDYIYMMQQGRIVTQGTPEEVLTVENISDVYEVPCSVTVHPERGTMQISYLL